MNGIIILQLALYIDAAEAKLVSVGLAQARPKYFRKNFRGGEFLRKY